ncbi:response regulator [Haloferax elongans ATCC BAA-1513]|uniref:Response regulator n=1 Tax=Haloferax elongans ATCC BAA-1513 TaxID=1230453 RepID=M0HDR1_HALEO|nr:response regulator [Haloferax elongans]ELZ82671.1 response regulator [Haloferax elongans ATCC BAA-1513]
MADTTLAQFEATVAGPSFERAQSAVVTLTPDALVVKSPDGQSVSIPLSVVFDFVVRIPDDGETERELVVGTTQNDQQKIVSIGGDEDTIGRFRVLFVKALLADASCVVTVDETCKSGSLAVTREGVAVDCDGRTARLRYESITRISREEQAVVLGADSGSIAVAFEQARHRNLFIRHLQTTPSVELESTHRPTVVVVDDEPNLAELVCHRLSALADGYDYVAYDDPNEALEAVQHDDVDCFVSDYSMPKMNGLELLRRVRDRDASLPFILYTGRGSETIAADAIGAGVTDYVPKSMGDEGYARLARRIETVV